MSTRIMVETQIKPRGVANPQVIRAMEQVQRDLFVPEGYRRLAFSDCPLPIHAGQTISQPYMVAAMTELLNIGPSSRVLEIGTGSGYQTAVLAEIAAEVYTVEIVESLHLAAQALLQLLGYRNIRFKLGDGHGGWAEHGPFDAILVTAAPEQVPVALQRQLKADGRLVIPVGPRSSIQTLQLWSLGAQGEFMQRDIMDVRFVPLVHES